jgi:nucleotide-binding universal stress UspA family protein
MVPAAEKHDRVSCSLREERGFLALRTGRLARLSDLVVFSRLPDDTFSEQNEALVEALVRSDRPILIAPEVPASLTQKIAIAWDGGHACTQALTAALPFLKRAGTVELLEVEPVSGNGLSIADAREYLKLHGISAGMRFVKRDARTVAETLLAEAGATGASMLVMGGYGHNRFAEALFGGVTSHIKWHPTLPVFMSH